VCINVSHLKEADETVGLHGKGEYWGHMDREAILPTFLRFTSKDESCLIMQFFACAMLTWQN